MSNSVKYPGVTVRLTGKDGNAIFIIGSVTAALKRAGVPQEEVDAFTYEAMDGTYDDMLRLCMRTVNVE